MSPPEVWGPSVWRFFHTLSEKINDDASVLLPQMFNFIVKFCKFLPCPDCSMSSSNFLAKIKISDLKKKIQFKNTIYIFHNWVNVKKRKALFNYSKIEMYKNYNLINVINNFIGNYQTNGNMKLLTETFQRQLIIKDFKRWFTLNIKAFIKINIPKNIQNSVITPSTVHIQGEPVTQKQIIVEDDYLNETNIVVDDYLNETNDGYSHESNDDYSNEKNVVEDFQKKIFIDDDSSHETIITDDSSQGSIVIEEQVLVDKKKKKKKNKNKNK